MKAVSGIREPGEQAGAREVLLVMQDGLSVGIGEKDFAVKQAKQLGISLEVIEYNEIDYSDEYQKNPENRCYYCKKVLHEFLDEIKEDRNFDWKVGLDIERKSHNWYGLPNSFTFDPIVLNGIDEEQNHIYFNAFGKIMFPDDDSIILFHCPV